MRKWVAGCALVLIAGSWWLLRGDSLEAYELVLSADRPSYQVGAAVTLRAEIRTDRADRIRLSADPTLAFRLSGRASVHEPRRVSEAEEGIETFELSPSQPHAIAIEGRISQEERGEIVVDFGEFGRFEMERPGDLVLRGRWIPARPSAVDSLEDYTNTVVITIAEAGSGERS